MPRKKRNAFGIQFFHVINRSVQRVPLFGRPADYRAFLGALGEGLQRHPIRLISYCVMPNHWHLVVGPVDPRTLSTLMHWVTTTHAVRWRLQRKSTGEGPVYQGRFKTEALEATDNLIRTCRYVERNPLRAGLVGRAQDWPWSSLSDRLRHTQTLPLVPTPFLSSDAWVAHVNAVGPNEGTRDRRRQGPSSALGTARTPRSRPGTGTVETVEKRYDP
jgi:putative transposase